MNTKLSKILAEISAGELIDKITILEIKKVKITNKNKLAEVEKELLSLNETMKKFVAEKGSIAINGISLTIAKVELDNFTISIIPHTYENTNLMSAKVSDQVNIEYDALARYVVKNV